jgi:hypothetical protein
MRSTLEGHLRCLLYEQLVSGDDVSGANAFVSRGANEFMSGRLSAARPPFGQPVPFGVVRSQPHHMAAFGGLAKFIWSAHGREVPVDSSTAEGTPKPLPRSGQSHSLFAAPPCDSRLPFHCSAINIGSVAVALFLVRNRDAPGLTGRRASMLFSQQWRRSRLRPLRPSSRSSRLRFRRCCAISMHLLLNFVT